MKDAHRFLAKYVCLLSKRAFVQKSYETENSFATVHAQQLSLSNV